ncbi:uncharacterized protein LOC141802824 [Halichoeres trimaculatus]|uniref:uncharacterized protein LOC141802824 n=1 Tax=Halichoeres trimaculatus TaxID=147232 RepID=UPI003D9F96B8
MADSGARPEGPKRFRTKEQIKHERDSDRARAKTQVNLGDAFNSWRELRRSKGLKSDPELALFLLNGAGGALSTPSEGAHRTVTDVDDTVPEETPSEHEEEDTSEFPDLMAVQDEDDLTEKSACIAYEECLRKLGSFLQLPIQTCPHVDPTTKTKCSCCSPFEVGISRRGTAFIMEWSCSNGHSVWKWNSQPQLKFGMQSGDLMLSSSILLSGSSYTKVGLLFKHMNMGMVVDTTLHSIQDSSMKGYWQRKRAEVLARLKERNSVTAHEFPADVQQLQMKEEPPWQEDQEDSEPQHVSETIQDGEQLQGPKEAATNTLPLNVVTVKNEEDEERLHLFQLNQRQTDQMETGDSDEDPESDRSSDSESSSTPEIEVMIEDSSDPDTDDSDDRRWSREKQSGLNSDEVRGESFNRQENLIGHKVVHTGMKPFCCSDCGKRFATSHYLIRHREIHTGEKPSSCSDNGKILSQKNQLRRHMTNRRQGKPFSCCECGKKYSDKERLDVHMRFHTGEKPFNCSECGRSFKHKHILNTHMMAHIERKLFNCSECGKQFKHEYLLIRHTRTHTGERPFSCPVCHNTFKQQSHLTSHMHIHSEEKPYSCSDCGKTFNQKSVLTTHMRVHTGERPFSCSVCQQTFRQKGHLTTHMHVHTKEKPLSCSECSKSFYNKWYLTAHMRVHTRGKEKRYSCSVCDRRFTWWFQLKKHKCVGGRTSELHQNQTKEGEEAEADTDTEDDGDSRGSSSQERSSDSERLQQPEAEIKTEFNDP